MSKNDLNRFECIGHLGNDVDMRFMPDGKAVANFSVASSWKTKTQEGTEWTSATAFEGLAQVCGDYLKKGSKVYIAGRKRTEEYTDKDGIKRYSTKIILTDMQMLDSKQDGHPRQQQDQPQSRQARNAAAAQSGGARFSDMDDTIPFASIPSRAIYSI